MLRTKTLTMLSGLVFAASVQMAGAENKTVTLTSLEWPPYTGAKLPGQGASVEVAKAAFKAMGYELKVEFYPWSRAVMLGKTNAAYAGYFPEYDSPDVRKDFTLSDPIGISPLGLAERKDAPFTWSKITDLASKKVGVVQDYVNTEEFDARVAAKQQPVEVANDDSKNLIKLGRSREDLAVVDKNVFNYLIKTDAELKPFASNLTMNAKLLEDKKLFICFKKGVEGQKMIAIFNEGLKKIDVNAIMKKSLAN